MLRGDRDHDGIKDFWDSALVVVEGPSALMTGRRGGGGLLLAGILSLRLPNVLKFGDQKRPMYGESFREMRRKGAHAGVHNITGCCRRRGRVGRRGER